MLQEVEQKHGQNYVFAEHLSPSPSPPLPKGALPVPINPKWLPSFFTSWPFMIEFHGCLAFLRQQIYFSTRQLISRR